MPGINVKLLLTKKIHFENKQKKKEGKKERNKKSEEKKEKKGKRS